MKEKRIYEIEEEQLDSDTSVAEYQIPINFKERDNRGPNSLRLLSLFSGCGGMDIGFEGGFIAPRKSFKENSDCIAKIIDDE